VDDTDELGKELTDRILELSRQVEELDRILGSGLAADEAAFAQALRERTHRFRVALEEAQALVQQRTGPTQPARESDAPPSPSVQPETRGRRRARADAEEPLDAPSGLPQPQSTREPEAQQRSSQESSPHEPPTPGLQPPEPRRLVFRIPGQPDVLVTQAEWDEIQALLATRSDAEPGSDEAAF
jgi:hypothetical protein